MQSWINQLGDLKNFEYIGIDNDDPDHVFVFKTEWTKKGWITSSFSLGKVNTFLDFRLNTRSDGIDKLLKNKK